MTQGTPSPSAPDAAPMHTQTQSTLAPTSEYVRYLLLALPARYIMRGAAGILFETEKLSSNIFGRGLTKIAEWGQNLFKIDRHAPLDVRKSKAASLYAITYNTALGLGSLALTASYSWTVYKDVKNIFGEAVAYETGKDATKINFNDLRQSDNRIVQKTMENYWKRTGKRILTDLLFFPAAAAHSDKAGDLMIGLKAGAAFAETWKRKTTMFEDLITFVNNKINPRNGLGQAISVGEVFDLYQHYTEAFEPQRMFNNVLERGTGEGQVWAGSQPIFQRITELMNLTYAYKHSSKIDPKTGHALHQADFALPKFVYLLGHDLIDVNKPEQTLTAIEIANRFGIASVKEMQAMLKAGNTLAQVTERFPIPQAKATEKKETEAEKNGVIAKGSTMQLDRAEAPTSRIEVNSITGGKLVAPALAHDLV